MPWTYSQTTGTLSRGGRVVGRGYSGKGIGLNISPMEATEGIGPLPRGWYRIGPAHTSHNTGPISMNLTPRGQNMFGRSAFLIHGDNGKGNNSASKGCIILDKNIRNLIASSGDRLLEVTF